MARLTRKNLKVFALGSSESGQFGSARIGTKVLSSDLDVIQGLPAWGQGWNNSTASGQEPPTLEEFQGVQYVHSYQTAYVLQEGIPEYSDTTEYYLTSLVKEEGTVKIYKSLISDNLGNPLSDTNSWRFVCDFETVQPQNNYEAIVDPTVNDDVTLGYSAGSYWYNTVTTDTFFCVNASEGAAVWVLQSSIDPSDLGTLAFQDNASGVPANDPNSTGQTTVQGQLNFSTLTSTEVQARGGTDNVSRMTPLRVRQEIDEFIFSPAGPLNSVPVSSGVFVQHSAPFAGKAIFVLSNTPSGAFRFTNDTANGGFWLNLPANTVQTRLEIIVAKGDSVGFFCPSSSTVIASGFVKSKGAI